MEDEKDDCPPSREVTLANIEHEQMRRLSYGQDATIRGTDRRKYRIDYENESETNVDIVIREK